MPQDLWQIRRRKGMSVKQLAAKTGLSPKELDAYENGELIRILHRHRLAKVLFVDPSDIKVQSAPKPARPAPRPKPRPEAKQKRPSPPQTTTKPARASQSPKPARPGQIEHLITMARVLGEDEAALTAKFGKPPAELTLPEAKKWLGEYHRLMRERKGQRPPGTRRSHIPLPEEVDEFELNYLQARQENGEMMTFKLFDGAAFTGQVVGFSPYAITVRQADGTEATIQKLALAYYTVHQEGAA